MTQLPLVIRFIKNNDPFIGILRLRQQENYNHLPFLPIHICLDKTTKRDSHLKCVSDVRVTSPCPIQLGIMV